jgi:hypothetical protein
MPVTKILMRCFAAYLVAFLLALLIPEHIHRRDFDRAIFTWVENRTAQNEAVLRSEQHKNEIIHLRDSAVVALLLVSAAYGIYRVVRFAKRSDSERVKAD